MQKTNTFLFFLVITLGLFAGQAAARDVVYLKDGDRITGQVIDLEDDEKKLVMETRYGMLKIDWIDVKSMDTSQVSVYEVDAHKTAAVQGNVVQEPVIEVPGRPVEITALGTVQATTDVPDSVVRVAAVEPAAGDGEDKVWNLFGGEITGLANLAASLQTGNTEQNAIGGDAEVKIKWDKSRARMKAEISREKDEGELTEDNRKVTLNYDYFYTEKWFLNTKGSAEQDKISDIDLRTTLGVGIGHQPFDTQALSLNYVLGAAYLREELENGDTEDSLAGEWSLDFKKKFNEGKFEFYHDHELLVPSDDTGAFLVETNTGVRTPLGMGIVAGFEVSFDWDNDPAPGRVEDDTEYRFKIGYEW